MPTPNPAPLPSGNRPDFIAKLVAEFDGALAAGELTSDEAERWRQARADLVKPAPPRRDRHTIRRRGHW